MHIMGTNDQIIPNNMGEELAAIFDDPCIVRHSGGHYFPASSREKNTYIEFLRNRLVEYLEKKELERAEAVVTNPTAPKSNGQPTEDYTDDSD